MEMMAASRCLDLSRRSSGDNHILENGVKCLITAQQNATNIIKDFLGIEVNAVKTDRFSQFQKYSEEKFKPCFLKHNLVDLEDGDLNLCLMDVEIR